MQTKPFARLASHLLATVTLPLALGSYAASLPPLTPAEHEAVIAEIKVMIETDENQIAEFIVKYATPERIDRLYQMPTILQQPKLVREHGLIFAGRGKLLTFDQPADVIDKIASWFPEELATVRAKNDPSFFGELRLLGPFTNWQPEQAAFMGLWNCMPQSAWLWPDESPFTKRKDGNLLQLGIAAMSSSPQEYSFGFCLRERSGLRSSFTEAEFRAHNDELRAISARAIPIVREKFARFLSSNRCKGIGPNDCVLILRLWADMLPDDTKLATSLRNLEKDIVTDRSMPSKRLAAFFRAKLLSILNAPRSWDATDLSATLRQLTLHRQEINADVERYQWQNYHLLFDEEGISPWSLVATRIDRHPQLRTGVLTELNRLDTEASCSDFLQWFAKAGSAVRTLYTVQRWQSQRPPYCAHPDATDWAWLKQGETEEARTIRQHYIVALNQNVSGEWREQMVSEFTNSGRSCFKPELHTAIDWVRKLCTDWVAEPLSVPFILPHSQLTLGAAQQFELAAFNPPLPMDNAIFASALDAWLKGMLPNMSTATAQSIHDRVADLLKTPLHHKSAKLWRHPLHKTALLELALHANENMHAVMTLTSQSIVPVTVPNRFRTRQSDGEPDYGIEVIQVSDLDEDGQLELWWAGSTWFNTCQGDESDLERTIDCVASRAQMGEIQGNALSYFTKSDRVANAVLTTPSYVARSPSELMPDLHQRKCNAILVGTVLAEKLGIDFGGTELNGERGDLVDLACGPHPLNPDHTIVALFHDLNCPNEPPNNDSISGYGFVAAVIDLQRKVVVSLYRGAMSEDASTRVQQYALAIDRSTHHLSAGVSALGITMNVGHCPRYADECAFNNLALFVQAGDRLVPALNDFPMSMLRATSDANSCRYHDGK